MFDHTAIKMRQIECVRTKCIFAFISPSPSLKIACVMSNVRELPLEALWEYTELFMRLSMATSTGFCYKFQGGQELCSVWINPQLMSARQPAVLCELSCWISVREFGVQASFLICTLMDTYPIYALGEMRRRSPVHFTEFVFVRLSVL